MSIRYQSNLDKRNIYCMRLVARVVQRTTFNLNTINVARSQENYFARGNCPGGRRFHRLRAIVCGINW